MKKYIITGTTGFLGSAICAELLKEECEIISLTRNDESGEKTLKAIYDACMGYDVSFDASAIKVVDLFSDTLIEDLRPLVDDNTEFIHSAAHMSYAWKNMGDAAAFNISYSSKLLLIAKELNLNSFNYISTLFTSNNHKNVSEDLHIENRPQNTYQTSKWLAENQLSLLAHKLEMPIRVFRPGIIIGHSENGWSTCKPFGFFMFLLGFMQVKSMGKNSIQIDLIPEVELPLVCVNDITKWIDYSLKTNIFGVFNLAYNNTAPASINNLRKLIQNELKIDIGFDNLKSLHDFAFDRKVKMNKDFAQKSWNFETEKLDKSVGLRELNNSSMIKSIEYFANNYSKDPKKFDVLKLLKNSKDNAFVLNDFVKNKFNLF